MSTMQSELAKPARTYVGVRDPDGNCHIFRFQFRPAKAPHELSLKKSLSVVNHSPGGFEWGYGGSGPAQSALAILMDHLHDWRAAELHHQAFKWRFLVNVNEDWFRVTGDQIDQWLSNEVHEQAAR